MTQHAAFYRGGRQFAVEPVAHRQPGPGEVAVDVAFVGICGTDMHVFHGNMDARVGRNRIIGHEMSGRVAAAAEGFAAGEAVVVRPLAPCGNCPACHAGNAHICHNLKFLGLDTDGAMQNRWIVPAYTLHRVPEGVSLDVAALVEPLAVTVHDVRRARLQAGEVALVIGGGPIGMLIAMVAKAEGARVILSEIYESRLAMAAEMGFEGLNPKTVNVAEAVLAITSNAGADVVFKVSGTQPGVDLMPQPGLLRKDGIDPWWMQYGGTWADGVALPQGIEARFRELGLAQVFGSCTAFIDQEKWHQWMNLKHEIEVMRRHPTIAGYVITKFTDVHSEGNGLLDMARNPRVFVPAMPKVNADIVISPGLSHHAARAGVAVTFDLTVSTGGADLPQGASLRWSFGSNTGDIPLRATGPMQAVAVPVTGPTDPQSVSKRETATFTIVAPDGRVLAQNDEVVSIYAKRDIARIHCATDDEILAERLDALGYKVTGPSEAQVFVTHKLDAARVEAIHAGTRVLQVVADAPLRLRNDLPRVGYAMTRPLATARCRWRSRITWAVCSRAAISLSPAISW